MKNDVLRKIGLGITSKEIIEQSNPIKKGRDQKDDEDYLEKTIGAFGLWQAVVSVTVSLTRAIAIWNMMSIGFLTPVTKFICIEFSENITEDVENSTCYDNCLKYQYSSVIENTIVENFQLICRDAWLASFTQSILMFGLLLGVSLFGWISDRFGRRTAFLLSTLINAVFMVALPFSKNYIVFSGIRFVIGIASGGSLIISVVQVLEITGKRYREIAGACCLLPDGLAEASLAGFAYFSSNWRSYTMSYGVATCIIFVMMIFVPESPRWLVSNGRVDEAVKVITSAAKRNKLDTSNIKSIIAKAVEDIKLQNQNTVKTTYLDFFKTKSILLRSITVFIIWFACGVCFYGIYQYVTIICIDPYLTVIVLGLIQMPLCPVGIIVNKTFGRKLSSIGATTVIGITMLILIFIPEGHWFGTLLGIIGFSCSAVNFAISYIYVTELFPTPLRNMAFGLSSGGAKVGAVISPFVANIVPRWLPSLIFGIFPFVAGFCCCSLPETKGQNLKDTIDK